VRVWDLFCLQVTKNYTVGRERKRWRSHFRSNSFFPSISDDAWIYAPPVVVAAHKYTCHHCSTIFKGFPVLLLYLQKTPNLISLFLGHVKCVRRSIHNLNSFFGKIAKILWNLRQMLIIVYIFYTDEHFGLMCVIDFEMTWLFALNYGFIFWGLWLFCGQLISVHEL
jgi:hypothetical protein